MSRMNTLACAHGNAPPGPVPVTSSPSLLRDGLGVLLAYVTELADGGQLGALRSPSDERRSGSSALETYGDRSRFAVTWAGPPDRRTSVE